MGRGRGWMGVVVAALAGGGLGTYQILQTYRRLNSIVKTGVLDRETKSKPEYVYVDDPLFELNIKREMDREKKHYVGIPLLWKNLKHSVAWRLLWLCRHGNREQRNMALHQLASIKIKDWDYRKLAQAMDQETAVLLARTEGADIRYFLPPPMHIRRAAMSDEYLAMAYRDLLWELNKLNPHKCLKYFLTKYYTNIQEQASDADILPKPDSITDQQLCVLALDAIYHHLSVFNEHDDPEHGDKAPGRILSKLGLLSRMSELLQRHGEDPELELCALRVLTHLSVHTELLQEFYRNGLLRHLCRWLHSSDVRFQCNAAVCLANLSGEGSYRSGVFLLHPVYRTGAPVKCDVLFLHGLRGGVFVTWRQRDPKADSPLGLFGKKLPKPANTDNAGVYKIMRVTRGQDGQPDGSQQQGSQPDGSRKQGCQPDSFRKNGDREQVDLAMESGESVADTKGCQNYCTLSATNSAMLADEDLREVLEDMESQEDEALLSEYEVVMHDLPEVSKRQSEHVAYSLTNNKSKCEALRREIEDYCSYTSCWPKDWLPRDCANLRIIGVNYMTSVTDWLSGCPHYAGTLSERAGSMRRALTRADVGGRDVPVVWLAHSMGGLIIKHILVDSWQSTEEWSRRIALCTRGVVMYSTPHQGSALASLPRTTAALLWPSSDVRQLREDSPVLQKLQESFLAAARELQWETVSFAESRPTLVSTFKVPVQFVGPESADLGLGPFYQLPLDHLSICKPATRQSILYTAVVGILQRAVGHSEDHNATKGSLLSQLLRLTPRRDADSPNEEGDARRSLEWFLLETFTDY